MQQETHRVRGCCWVEGKTETEMGKTKASECLPIEKNDHSVKTYIPTIPLRTLRYRFSTFVFFSFLAATYPTALYRKIWIDRPMNVPTDGIFLGFCNKCIQAFQTVAGIFEIDIYLNNEKGFST